jgi:hypothetical protein
VYILYILWCIFFRFVYGRVKNFQNATFGTEVYKFANEMQISALTKKLIVFLKETNRPADVFTIFDLYAMFEDQLGCDSCKLVI